MIELGDFFDGTIRPGDAVGKIAKLSRWELEETTLGSLTLNRIRGVAVSELEDIKTQLEEQLRELAAVAMRDQLTGLPNRQKIIDQYDRRRNRGYRTTDAAPAGQLLAIDFDHFKQVNDTFGHQTGDKVLRTAAQAMDASLRDGDIVGRTGGDEFTALVKASPAHTDIVADRMRAMVAHGLGEAGLAKDIITLSIGAVATDYSADFEKTHHLADMAMYVAKAAGGDRITHWLEP